MNDQTQGFWRRFIVIGFPNAVPVERQNPNLVAELSTELPEFVGWCLAGAAEALAQNQLTTPASSAPALKEWRLEADQVASFLGDATEPDPEFGVSASELYRQYRGWAATNGHRTLSSVSFGKRAILAGAARRHTSSGNVYLVKFRRQYITA
jgi:putative DNA primase/helicase